MIGLEHKSNPYIASLIVDLLYKLTLCGSVCLPYIISYLASIDSGFRKEVIITSSYNSEHRLAYDIIGTIAVLLNNVTMFRTWVSRIGRVARGLLFNSLSVIT